MNSTPLVSIIIPTYNRAHLIGETLDSVLEQTYTHWECIIVDDGSTDDTAKVIGEYVQKDGRFQYHERPKDRLAGGNAARNYGFEMSEGEYIQWFDSDDLFVKEAIEEKIKIALKDIDRYSFVLCGFETFGVEENFKKEYAMMEVRNIVNIFLERNFVLNTPSLFFKRELVQDFKFDEGLTRAQDLDFDFRVLKTKNVVGVIIPNVLIKVRLHEETITSSFENNDLVDLLSELKVWKDIYDYLRKESDNENAFIAYFKCMKNLKKVMLAKDVKIYVRELYGVYDCEFKLIFLIIGYIYQITNRGEHLYNLLLNHVINKNMSNDSR